MTLQQFIQAMPKVALSIRFEGALTKRVFDRLLAHHDIETSYRTINQFQKVVTAFQEYDAGTDEHTIQEITSWMKYADEIGRAAYELGVSLHQQNVRYAEVSFTPTLYTDNGISFEDLMATLVDARDRVLRGWGVTMNWVIALPRHQPRKADEIVRFATGITAGRSHVVALALTGQTGSNEVSDFERVMAQASKRGMPVVLHARASNQEQLTDIIGSIEPGRLTDFRLPDKNEDVITALKEKDITVVVSPSYNRVSSDKKVSYRSLLDSGIRVAVDSSMPYFWKTSTTHELELFADSEDISAEDVIAVTLNAVDATYLAEDEQAVLRTAIEEGIESAREHLEEVAAE